MKRLFIPAAALSLALATPAFATPDHASAPVSARAPMHLAQMERRDRDRDRDKERDRSRTPGAQHKPAGPVTPARPGVHRPGMTGPAMPARPGAHRPGMTGPAMQRPQRYDWNQYKPGHRPPQWNQHRERDHSRWMRNYRAEKRYHWRPYVRPQGWYYRRWVFGTLLPHLFCTQDYWINDYWQFGLMDPPYGYVWVRYGDDALLVNVQTGYVLQVVYNLFD